jgi:hypothetical protein
MCHSLYDNIHGREKITKIFYPISEEQLQEIIKIYKADIFLRSNLIDKYLEKIPEIENRVQIEDGVLNTSTFYVNAVQHYISNDYQL